VSEKFLLFGQEKDFLVTNFLVAILSFFIYYETVARFITLIPEKKQ